MKAGESLAILEEQIAHVRTSVNVLKLLATLELSPGNPLAGLKMLAESEKTIKPVTDPDSKQREDFRETLAALQAWIKLGRPNPDS
jgi:hypothetical protein